jgi:PAS domain S-box-containing protein
MAAPVPRKNAREATLDSTARLELLVDSLDVATVVRAFQAVSTEIDLEEFIRRLLVTAIEHTGAERGLLMLPRDGRFWIEAEALVQTGSIDIRLRGEVTTASELPSSVLEYVARTRETVLVDDAIAGHRFGSDDYIVRKRIQSILCLPLVKQAKLVGVLYLETTLTSHVFTPERISVLCLLASQAAISLENACLYADLNRAEKELRDLVDSVPQHIVVLAPDGTRLYANRVMLDYLGCSVDDLRHPNFHRTVCHPDDFERLVSARHKLARGESFDVETRMRGKDGVYRWFLFRYQPFRDEQGKISRWYATATEIEERKRAEEQLRKENIALRDEVDKASMFEEIVGTSAALQVVLSSVSKVAAADTTVLITGETGTGKELIARAIHKRSARGARAFVSVNCAAIPQSLIASELFGHEKGAFTGALQRRLGRFEMAEGGTLFLDEVGELPAETQVALLRVLQEREFERVGGSRVIPVDVRVIAATNRDLEKAVAAGNFRSDLFYRLNVFPIEMPPLRERKDDIPMLVSYFIDRFASRAGRKFRDVSRRSLELLQAYRWPGNVRELQNVIERSVIVSEGDVLSVRESWLSRSKEPRGDTSGALADTLTAQEKAMIEAALAQSGGRVAGLHGAAEALGMRPSTLESKIRSLKINKHRFRDG